MQGGGGGRQQALQRDGPCKGAVSGMAQGRHGKGGWHGRKRHGGGEAWQAWRH